MSRNIYQNRFYNNIFVQAHPITNDEPKETPFYQQVGTHVWDEYPTYEEWIAQFDMDVEKPDMGKLEPAHFGHLPVWADGNVYLAGAKAWAKETNKLVDEDAKVLIALEEEDGQYKLSTNLYEFMKDFKTGIINSDILGKAFEPEQRFEERDGSDIVFQSDYLGNHRGISTIPGPFASAEELNEVIWVD